jgi:hypothetical protein
MAKHYHAIPAVLRGNSYGNKPTIITTEHGDIEEGCLKRITSVFSDIEKTEEELEAMLETLVNEYLAHTKLASAAIEAVKASRLKPAPAQQSSLDSVFEKFLQGDLVGLHLYIQANPKERAKLRTYTNGKVEDISPSGTVRIKRDNNQSRVTMFYSLPTKLKVGDLVFIRDTGGSGVPTAQAVWVNVKNHAVRGDELKQFI